MTVARPQPIYDDATRLSELGTAEMFMVAALRLWVVNQRAPNARFPDWRHGFKAARVDDAAAAFDVLMHVVGTAARRDLHVRHLSCALLGSDEAWLLTALGLIQSERFAEAEASLGDSLPATALRVAAPQLLQLATAMANAGLRIPLFARECGRLDRQALHVYADRGLRLVQ